jgi:PST family polysaccharide transporter
MVKKLSLDNIIILKNLSFLSVIRVFNVGINFLLVAYLIRTIGETNYGILTWVDSVIQYFIVFVNFGFNVYAAKYIIKKRENSNEINKITSAIFSIKMGLFTISVLILFSLSFLNPLKPYREYLLLMNMMCLGEVLFPIWYFQGIEKLKTAMFITVFFKLGLLFSTFLLVKTPAGLNTYIFLLVISNSLIGVFGYFSIKYYYGFVFIWVKKSTIIKILKQAYMFFLGRFLSLTFNFLTIFVIGIYFSMGQVSGFDISLKVILVCIIPYDILQQAVFPTISRNKDKRLLKKLIVFSFLSGIAFTIGIFLFSSDILFLLAGEEGRSYSLILLLMSPIPPLVAVSFILGTCTLVAFGYEKEYNQSLIISSVIYLILLLAMKATSTISFWSLIYLRVFSDLMLLLIRTYFVYKRKILSLN